MVVVGGIVVAVVALLAVPLDLAFRVEGVEAFSGKLAVRWLFGLVRLELELPRVRAKPQARPPPAAVDDRARGRARTRPRRLVAALRQPAFRRRALRLVQALVRAAHPSDLRVRMRLGLGDPADTGRLWAVLGPLSAAAMGLRGADVRIEPEFFEPVLELDARGRARLVPLQLLALALAFALAPSSLRAWRALRAGDA